MKKILLAACLLLPAAAFAQDMGLGEARDLERKGIEAKTHGDFEGARDALKRAAELGYYPAQVDYASLLETGPPPVRDLTEAYGWYAVIGTHPDSDFAKDAEKRIRDKVPAADRAKLDEVAQDHINRFFR